MINRILKIAESYLLSTPPLGFRLLKQPCPLAKLQAAAFLDPLFFFLPVVNITQACVDLDWGFAVTLTVLRSFTDFMYLLYIVVQFRLAYTAPGSKVFGRGELVREPRKIAWRYLTSNFALDVFAMLPLPQVRGRPITSG
jgi:hypothetical protein